MQYFDARTGEWSEPRDRLCSLFDLGGHSSGSSTSTGSQNTSAQFIPTVTIDQPQPLVGGYPAGQGLATLNTAYPASAAFLPSTYTTTAPATVSTSASASLTTWLLLAGAVGVGAWFLLRHRKR